jgi:TP901-1 family phage major tail protein
MAGANGRALTISWDSTTLVGVRTRGYTLTNDHVDVTTDDDSGWRTLLATPGMRSVEVTVGGVSSDQVLIAAMMASSVTGEAISIGLPTTTGTLAGSFFVSSFEQNGEHDGAVEFSATFMSSGAVVYTAGV